MAIAVPFLLLAAHGAREAAAGSSPSGSLSIEASLDREEIAPGEAATLTVVIRASGVNLPDVELPALPGIVAQRAGTAQNFSMANGRVERSSSSVFRLFARAEGVVRIPP
ncbi:MAG: BatD family protein, partial [Candidatus Latescibacteria bacterium]|nr:BatD family protein [Candidatus Latescibacterota bacterium]